MNIAIVGAGIGGLTAGIALRQKGHHVRIYERAPSFKNVGTGIVVAANAMHVYRDLGIAKAIEGHGRPLTNARIDRPDGSRIAGLDLGELAQRLGARHVGIHRAALHEVLANAFGGEAIHCGHELVSVTHEDASASATFSNGESVSVDLLVGADGLRSAVREALFGPSSLRDAEQFCWRGVLERSTLSCADEMNWNEAHEQWGLGARFGFVPINDAQLYWFATLSNALLDFDPADDEAFRARMVPLWNPTVRAILEATPKGGIVAQPLMDKAPATRWREGRVVLLGDAIHSTTPNMGQGACMAIESAWALAHCLNAEPDVDAGLDAYQALRKPRTTMITQRSLRMGALFQTRSAFKAKVRNGLMGSVPHRLQLRAAAKMFGDHPVATVRGNS